MTACGVRHWLSSLNLHEQYEELLLAAGYDTLEKCAELNDALLEQIGIIPAGHRRRILLHLPRTVTDPSTPAEYDSEDDREIYDIPPVGLKPSAAPKREFVYTNFVEMNEIPKPVLPPKKRLSSDNEVGARLGIVSPPVKPHLPYGIFDPSSSPTDGVHAKPKLCVVYPEKRPPVPARRISRDGKASSVNAENQLNNNVGWFEPGTLQQRPTTAATAPVAMPRTCLKHQVSLNEGDNKMDTDRGVTAVSNVTPVHGDRSVPVTSVPEPSLQVEDGSADATSQEKRLNSDLEQELQNIVSIAKKSMLRKVDLDTDAATDSCNTTVAISSAVVQPCDSSSTVSSVPSNSISYRTAMVKETLTSITTSDTCSLEADGAETTDLEHAHVIDDDTSNADHFLQTSLDENQGPKVTDMEPVLLREKVEPSDDFVYETMDTVVSQEHNSDERSSSEYGYPPPVFPPPPLPTEFARFMHLKSGAGKPVPPSRISTSRMSGLTESIKPQPPPRRRQSSMDIVDDTLSPIAAGFSSALDDYLIKKDNSATAWLNQPSEYLGRISDVSDSDFGAFDDTQPPEPLLEFTKHISSRKLQSIVQSDAASEENVLCEFITEPAEDVKFASMSPITKTKSFNNDAQSSVKPLNSEDDFKEDTCSKETGDCIKSCILYNSFFCI